MTKRHANAVFLAAFILVGAIYLYASLPLISVSASGTLGPAQVPVMLGVLLVALCAVEFVLNVRRKTEEDQEPLDVPNAGKLVLTVLTTALYFALWWWTHQFYVVTALFFFALVSLYKSENSIRSAAVTALIAILFSAGLYVVFDVAFNVQLN